MSRILITGSTQGVGFNAAGQLLDEGHEVILHARNTARAESFGALADRAAGVVTGDLSLMQEVAALADQVNALGPIDAIIHNAGILGGSARKETAEGRLQVLAVNTLAPYLLSQRVAARRLIFTGSSMHYGHDGALNDIEWTTRRWASSQAYGESKMLVGALSKALARRWPEVLCNTVDPGWVPTRMGGASASDPLDLAHRTQVWLATSDDVEAQVSGGYWHHMNTRSPDPKTTAPGFQDALMDRLDALIGNCFG